MANENFLEKLAAQFDQSASVKNVYGSLYHQQPTFYIRRTCKKGYDIPRIYQALPCR
jgi:hypothetical protein